MPLHLVLYSSLVEDSDGASLLLRFLSPAPGSKHVRAWLRQQAPRERSNITSTMLRQQLEGPFSNLRLTKIEGRIAPDDVQAAQKWSTRVFELAYTSSTTGNQLKPYRRLRVIINPVGGPGKASLLFRTRVRPILEAAGCKLDITFTTHRFHGLEIARDEPDLAEKFDSIVCVSGDGMVHEVLNGLVTRKVDAKRTLEQLAVAPIPTGSGNATSVSLLGAKQGFNLAQAALNVIKGEPMSLDVCTVTQLPENGADNVNPLPIPGADTRSHLPCLQYYSFLSQAIGLMADLDVGTEHLRILGDTRFVIGYLEGTVANKEALVHVDVKLGARGTVDRSKMRERAAGNRFEPAPIALDTDGNLPSLQHGSVLDDLGGENLPDLDVLDPSWPSNLPLLQKGKKTSKSLPGDCPSSLPAAPGWARLRQPISALYAGKLPYVARDLLEFPYALPGDGTIDMVTLLHSGGRLAKLRTIGGAETGEATYDRSVAYLKVEAFRVTPRLHAGDRRLKKGGLISIDGEQVPYSPFQVEITPGLRMQVLSLYGSYAAPTVHPPQ